MLVGATSRLLVGITAMSPLMVSGCRPMVPCPTAPLSAVSPAPRRDRCLQPPYVADLAKPDERPGWRARQCGGPAQGEWVHEGNADIDWDTLKAIKDELWAAAVAGAKHGSIGLGACCGNQERVAPGQTPVRCLVLSYDLCALAMADVVKLVEDALRSRGVAEARMGLSFTLSGAAGPRCHPDDPACGPVSYVERPTSSRQDVCSNRRTPIDRAFSPGYRRLSSGTCSHDGECSVGGCGNRCTVWTNAGGLGTCEGYPRLEEAPAYCGCVEGRCTWFVVE